LTTEATDSSLVEVGHPGGRGDSRGVAAGSDHLETRPGERDRCRFADA